MYVIVREDGMYVSRRGPVSIVQAQLDEAGKWHFYQGT